MQKKRTRPLSFSFALLWIISICGLMGCSPSAPSNPATPEIRIGILAPLSGDLAESVGKPMAEGAMLAAQQVNDAGGLEVGGQKYKVTLITADDQDNPQTAVDAARKLIAKENAAVLVGAPFSRIAIPVAMLAEGQRIPFVTPAATNPAVTAGRKYAFRAIFTDPFQGTMLARFAMDELHIRKVAALFDAASEYNRDLAGFFKSRFEAAGGEVVAFESYTTGEKDWSRQLSLIASSGAEALFLPNYANEAPAQARQARQLGFTQPFIGGDAWGSIQPGDLDGLENGFFASGYATESDTAQNKAFIAAYQRAHPKGRLQQDAALAFDACGLVFQAIRNTSRTDPESIRDGLANMKRYTGATGDMAFDGSGDPVKSLMIMQVKGGGFAFYKQVNP